MPLFFILAYPEYKVQFSLIYAGIQMFLGFASSMVGGVLAGKFGARNYARICQASSLLAIPLLLISVLQTGSFWLSIGCTAMRYIVAEWFWSPNVTMMQQSVKAGSFGNCISAY